MRHHFPDQSRHESVRAQLSIFEGVRLTKQDFQHTRDSTVMIDRQDQERFGTELPAYRRVNSSVGFGIFDAQNLSARIALRRHRERGHHLLSDVHCATSTSGPEDQSISLQQTDTDSGGFGHIARAVSDQVGSPIQVELSALDQALDFDNG